VEHFSRAIELARMIGEKSVLCLAYLDLGLFHKWSKENEKAEECLRLPSRSWRRADPVLV